MASEHSWSCHRPCPAATYSAVGWAGRSQLLLVAFPKQARAGSTGARHHAMPQCPPHPAIECMESVCKDLCTRLEHRGPQPQAGMGPLHHPQRYPVGTQEV